MKMKVCFKLNYSDNIGVCGREGTADPKAKDCRVLNLINYFNALSQ